ncbi:MAG: diguanylate cyclase [Brachyspira sp.]|nr:diguanylate cyclase [Brachyspira sp.]
MQTVTLIIDKRRELSVKYKKLLANQYSQVIISKNLLSAMKTIQDKEPDLIIISDSIDSDLSDYCKKIRALTYNMRPIIIAMSKSAELDDRIKVLDSGADDFMSEPVNSEEFVMRIKAHLRREFESNLDYKKMLPNKNYSMRALKRMLTSNRQWACLYVTVENFNNYSESYTRLASDKLLQTYAAIISSALNENDYLGALAENEFLIISDLYKAEKIANFLTFAFDTVMQKFYSPQDLKRGYIILHGDEQAGRRCDFMHTTIGIVTNEFKEYNDVQQILASLVNIHSIANLPSKSNYLMERAKISAQDSIMEKSYNKKISIFETDDAMTLLLRTILEMQGYDVMTSDVFCESDDIPAIIILDAGNSEDKKGLEICRKIKNNIKYKDTKLIITSIYHDKELVLDTGADLYLPKPFEISSLVKWVEVFMKEVNNY